MCDMNITLFHKAARTRRGHGPKLPEARFEDYEQIAGLEARFGLTVKPYRVEASVAGQSAVSPIEK